MKKHFSKRILSAFLAMLMLITSVPISAVTTFGATGDGYVWNEIAKTDFTTENRTWTENYEYNKAQSTKTTDGVNYWTTNGYLYNDNATSGLSWALAEYYSGTDVATDSSYAQSDMPNPFNASTQATSDGLSINDGYLYLTSFNGSSIFPTNGSKEFKIDLEFQYTSDFSISDAGKYCFMKLTTNSSAMNKNGKPFEAFGTNNFFAQDLYGKFYVGSSNRGSSGTTYGKDYMFSTNNSKISANTTYHYVFKYIKGFITADIIDENGNTILNTGYAYTDAKPDTITGIMFGDTNNSYYMHSVKYKSVTFSSGESSSPSKTVDINRDKYLFAYFTGNDDQNVRLAVSDDGYNFESLNGNTKILRNDPSACYPSTTTNTGIGSSNAARDPFIMQKADGSGYYVIATDLDITGPRGYSNTKLLVWDIANLADIGETQPWNVETCDWIPNYSDVYKDGSFDFYAWAPEAIWDEEAQMYMMYWSSSMIYYKKGTLGIGAGWESNAQKRLYYAYTSDFKTFYADSAKTKELGTGNAPNMLFDYDFTSIDADITYDGNLYYMYFKHEDDKDIYYAVSDKASGPYCGPKKLDVGYYDSKSIEGVQVYQLYDGNYNLVGDCYEEDKNGYKYDGYFVTLSSTTGLAGFDANVNDNPGNMNYLTPRHGCIVNITTKEYKDLISKYGKCTIDANGLIDGSDVNSHLIARYFFDGATGDVKNGNNLTANNVKWAQDDERGYATFTADSTDNTSANYANSSYATIDFSNFSSYNLNLKDGITFDWYGYIDTATDYSRFFEITTAANPGAFTSPTNGSYLFYGSKNGYAVSDSSTETDCWGYSQITNYNSTGKWRRYTLNITEHYVSLFVDGVLLGKRYVYRDIQDLSNRTGATGSTGEGASDSSGSPTYTKELNNTWLTNMLTNGKLMFGASSFASDQMFSGRISDFRIYNHALSAGEIKTSISKLESSAVADTLDDMFTNLTYFDPMDSGIYNGVQKTGYGSKSIEDTVKVDTDNDGNVDTPVHGIVLNNAGATNSNYTYYASQLKNTKGITITMGYHNGSSVGGNILDIGGFTVTESGEIKLNGTTVATGVFGNAIKNGEWQHLAFLIIKGNESTTISTYVGGAFVTRKTVSIDVQNLLMGSSNLSVVYGSSDSEGMLKDVCIYDGVYTAYSTYMESALYHVDTMAPYLCQKFEDTIKAITSTSLYKNIAPAYAAYDELMRYIDSINYGETSADNELETQYYIKLRLAMNDMTPYEKPNTMPSMTQAETGVKNSVSEIYRQNMLSGVIMTGVSELTQNEDGTGKKGTEVEKISARISTGSFVWLYDGETTLTSPMYGGVYKKYWQQRDICYIAPNSTKFKFGGLGTAITGKSKDGPWLLSGSTNADVNWYYEQSEFGNSTFASTEITSNRFTIKEDAWYPAANYITYTDGANLEASGAYYESFPIKCITQRNGGAKCYITGGNVYVINYIPVKNALTNNISKLKNITDYSKDSVIEFIKAYDALTSMDYCCFGNSPNLNQVTNKDGTGLVDRLKANVDILNRFTDANFKETVDKSNLNSYTKEAEEILNKGIDSAKEVVDGKEVNTQYTTSSWSNYQQSVQDVKNYYTSLNPSGDNQNYLEKTSVDGESLVNNIATAKKNLVVVADYSGVDTIVSNGKKEIIDSQDNQVYTLGSWLPYSDAYEIANSLSGKTTAEKLNTPKYDVSASGYVGTDNSTWNTLSTQQNDIDIAEQNVNTTEQNLAVVDTDSAYQNYNTSQTLFAKSDQDAYLETAISTVNGYGTTLNAPEYNGSNDAVYVNYNGRVYENTTTGETDSYTSKVLTTINGGDESTNGNTRKSYTVTFNYIENGSVTQTVLDNEIHYYGDIVNMSYTGSGTVEGWDVTSGKSTPTSINNATNDFALKVQANTVVNVYATTPDNTRCVVKVLDYFGRARVAYVNPGTVATVSGETVSFNDGSTASITNQSCSYYTFNGFAVSGSMTDNGNGTYTINGDTVFTATGSKDKSAMNYTVTGGTFADGSTSAAYAMDDVITITPSIANCIGIALVTDSGYTMLSYGESSFTFYAFPVAAAFGEAVQLACVAADDANLTDNQKGHVPDSFGLGLRSSDGSKISMYCMMTTGDSNAKIVERGIVITKSEKNEAQLIKGADGVTKFTSSSDVNSSQYLITIRTSASVWARSYVSYTVDTVVNGQKVNVPMVAYGEIQAIPAV